MCGKVNLQLIWSSVQCHQCNLASNVDRSSSFKCWDLELQVKILSNNNNQYDKQLMHWNYVSVSMIYPQVIGCFPVQASFDPWCKIGVQCSQFLPGCHEHLEARNCTSKNGVRFTRNHHEESDFLISCNSHMFSEGHTSRITSKSASTDHSVSGIL